MPVNTYEGMFILDSTKAAAGWEAAEGQVHDILKKHNAEIVASRLWDERRLAYPIGGNRKGIFTRDRHPKAAALLLRRRWRGLA